MFWAHALGIVQEASLAWGWAFPVPDPGADYASFIISYAICPYWHAAVRRVSNHHTHRAGGRSWHEWSMRHILFNIYGTHFCFCLVFLSQKIFSNQLDTSRLDSPEKSGFTPVFSACHSVLTRQCYRLSLGGWSEALAWSPSDSASDRLMQVAGFTVVMPLHYTYGEEAGNRANRPTTCEG